jgi:hypothetical protein
MMDRITRTAFIAVLAWMIQASVTAQGSIWGIAGGPSLSTQHVNGFEEDGFMRYHVMGFVESSSEISPNALYARLGYHIKGSAVNAQQYYNPDTGEESRSDKSTMEFGNLSFSLGVKQRREIGTTFLSYGFGLRLDYNVATDFDPLFAGLEGAQNKFTYGLNLETGWEFPISELTSTFFEIGFYPDLIEQIFIPPQEYYTTGGIPVILPETKLTNVVFEARVGFRFWNKIIYTD